MSDTTMVFAHEFKRLYHTGMVSRLRELRTAKELSQEALAELAGTSQPQIKRLELGERKLTKEWADRIAPHLGVSPSELIFPVRGVQRSLAIVGRVGASTDGEIIHDSDQAPFGEIGVPLGATGSEAVVEVTGHSMGMYAPNGSLILYESRSDPPREDMLGEVCVVGLADGRTLLKRLLRGSKRGLYDLESVVGNTMRDQVVAWAAVVTQVIHPRHARRLRIA